MDGSTVQNMFYFIRVPFSVSLQAGESLPLSFGMNLKAQLAARTMFALAYRHGDILREGWKNILDCMLQLYRAKMLPSSMVEVRRFEDILLKLDIELFRAFRTYMDLANFDLDFFP